MVGVLRNGQLAGTAVMEGFSTMAMNNISVSIVGVDQALISYPC